MSYSAAAVSAIVGVIGEIPGRGFHSIDGFSPGELYRGIFRGTLLDQTLKAKDVCGLV